MARFPVWGLGDVEAGYAEVALQVPPADGHPCGGGGSGSGRPFRRAPLVVLALASFGAACFAVSNRVGWRSRRPGPGAGASVPGVVALSEEAPLAPAYDVVVVGAGVVGSAVAARLAEKLPANRQILVLEAGAASHASLGGKEQPSWSDLGNDVTKYDVPGHYSTLNCWNRDCKLAWQGIPRYACKILGGCGVMNGALTQLPHPRMFDAWPDGWRWPDMEPYYAKADQFFNVTQTPSTDGKHYLDGTPAKVVEEALARMGFEREAPRRPRSNTMGVPFVTAADGKRQSTASVFLPPVMSRPNFDLRLSSTVSEILHNGLGEATGLRYVDDMNISRTALLSQDGFIVLSGGAFNTPKLLLKSNLVPGNAQIGRGLTDHTYMAQVYRVPRNASSEMFCYEEPSHEARAQYMRNKTGSFAQFGPILTAFFRDNETQGGPDEWDVEMFLSPACTDSSVKVDFALIRPTCSSADLRWKEGDEFVLENDRLHHSCDRDRQMLRAAMGSLGAAMKEQGAVLLEEQGPYDMNHWAGTCALGRCADPETMRVMGSRNVAVADASLLPVPVWGHPVHTLRAVALKAADKLEASMVPRYSYF